MWISRKLSTDRTARLEGAATDMGVTTAGGASASVLTRGEQRNLEVFSPGGLIWQPKTGDTVLVVKGGSGAKETCVIAAENASHTPSDMTPGELYLFSNADTYIFLRQDGSVVIHGDVSITGSLSVTGNVTLNGRTDIWGSLYINGTPCNPCTCGG